MQLVSWAEDGTIIGAEPDGTVHASTDGGQAWEQRGNLGAAPQALTATGAGEVFAAIEGQSSSPTMTESPSPCGTASSEPCRGLTAGTEALDFWR